MCIVLILLHVVILTLFMEISNYVCTCTCTLQKKYLHPILLIVIDQTTNICHVTSCGQKIKFRWQHVTDVLTTCIAQLILTQP